MAAVPNIRLPSIREPIPPFYVLGRVSTGVGQIELLDFPTLKAYLYDGVQPTGPADLDFAVQYNSGGAFGGDHVKFSWHYSGSESPYLKLIGGDTNQHGALRAAFSTGGGYLAIGYKES